MANSDKGSEAEASLTPLWAHFREAVSAGATAEAASRSLLPAHPDALAVTGVWILGVDYGNVVPGPTIDLLICPTVSCSEQVVPAAAVE